MRGNAGKLTVPQRLQAAIHLYKSSGQWQPQSLDDLDRWMDATVSGQDPRAMAFTAYFSGVMQISQTIASIAFPLYKRTGEMRKKAWLEHPVYKLLNGKANPWVDAFRWRETAQMQCCNYGNSYSYIVRDQAFRPKEAYLLQADRMKVDLLDSGEPVYIYRMKSGGERIFTYNEIFHLSGFGPDYFMGYSLLELHKAALAVGLQQQNFINNFIKKGVHSSGILVHPKTLGEVAKSNLRESLQAQHAGSNNAGRILIFEEGMKWEPFSMPLKDAEFLGSRVFQIQEMARILNMPPHKLKDMSQATFSNIEHQQIEYATDTMRPWAERWEKAVDTQLLTPIERTKGFSQHDLNQLMRGDMKTVMETQRIGRFAGILNADEARFNIGMNALEDEAIGKRYWQPVNMVDASSDLAAGILPEADIPQLPDRTE